MEGTLEVTSYLAIPREELSVSFARSGGPGGQNVNKVNSKVVLKLSLATPSLAALSEEQRARLKAKLPARYLTKEDEIVISASEHRDQLRNREAAEARLVMVLREALARPKTRRATKPGKAARAKRRDAKEKLSKKKAQRRSFGD